MKKLFIKTVAACAGAVLALTGAAHAIDVKKQVSEKGITFFHVEDRTLPIITMYFTFKAGTVQDPIGKGGALSLATSLLTKGAGDLNEAEYKDRVDELSMRLSYSASRDYFTGSFQTLKPNADAAFDLFKLTFSEPRFDDAPMARVKEQFITGIKNEKVKPSYKAGLIAREMFYPAGHRYIRPSGGTEDEVKALTADDLRAVLQRVLSRDVLKLTIVGDITAKEAGARIDALFADLPEKTDLVKVEKVRLNVGKPIEVASDKPQVSFTIFGQGISRDDPQYFAAYLLNNVLGASGLSSRLSQEVREKRGLVYSIGSGLQDNDGASLFTVSFKTQLQTAETALQVTLDEIEKIAENGLSEEELELTKVNVIASYALNFSSSSAVASTFTWVQNDGNGADYLDVRKTRFNAVTVDDIKSVAKRLFADAKFTIMRIGPTTN